MRKNMKKWSATLLAAVMVMSLTACGGKGEKSSGKKEEGNSKDYIYAAEELALEGIEGDINNFVVKGDKIYFSTYDWVEGDTKDVVSKDTKEEDANSEEPVTDEDTSSEEAVTEEDTNSDETATEEDSKKDDEEQAVEEEVAESDETGGADGYAVQRMYCSAKDGSNVEEIKMPDFSENEWINTMAVEGEDVISVLLGGYDQKTEKQTYCMVKFDFAGKELVREDITKLVMTSEESYINGQISDDKGRTVFGMDNKLLLIDENIKKLGEIKIDTYVSALAKAKDGTILAAIEGEDGVQIKRVDMDKQQLEDVMKLDVSYLNGSNALMDGADYDFYYRTETGVYGCDIASKKQTKLLDFMASDLNGNDMYNLKVFDGNQFIGSGYEGDHTYIKVLSKVDPSTIADKESIVIAAPYLDDGIKRAALDFNKKQDKYKIEIREYSDAEDPSAKMNAEIAAGNIPDIIDLSWLSAEQCVAKGLLEDLTPYFEKDAELSEDDILDSVREAMKIDGKLYYVAPTFGVSSIVGKTKDVGDAMGWTFDDLKALLKEKGDSVRPFQGEDKESLMYSLLSNSYGDFIDWSTGECTFTDPDFKSILEMCNTAKSMEYEYDENAPQLPELIQKGQVLLIDGWMDLEQTQVYQKMYGDDITFIGYPNKDKDGQYFNISSAYGISAKSKVKDGAWEFLRTIMTKEYQGDNRNIWGTPTRKDCFDNYLKRYMATEKYTDEFGNEVEPINSSYGYDNWETEIVPFTQKEIDTYKDLINNTHKISPNNWDIMNIITEEAKAYFSGDKTVDETADVIQNRVKTYVNENR